MTERSLAAIAATAETRWQLLGCTIIHRIGRLVPGEPIVLVLTAAAHREPRSGRHRFPDRLAQDQSPVLEIRRDHRRHRPLGRSPRQR